MAATDVLAIGAAAVAVLAIGLFPTALLNLVGFSG
jgi:hypothetical protein